MSTATQSVGTIVADGDVYDLTTPRFIDAATVKALSQIKPWRGIFQIVLEWTGIFGAIFLCNRYWNPILYILTVMWIGARQNGLGVLMHEAVHYRLLPNKTLNEWVGDLFTAWPVLVTVDGFRQTHWAHHRHVNGSDDPDWQMERRYPRSVMEVVMITFSFWIGMHGPRLFFELNRNRKITSLRRNLRLGFYCAILVASVFFHFWLGLLIYWIVPLLTYCAWIIYIRGAAEHFGVNDDDLLSKTRHIEANLFERLLLAPNFIHVHIGHHLYPSVPFYNLRELQRRLMMNPDYARRAHVTNGYIALVREILSANAAAPQPV